MQNPVPDAEWRDFLISCPWYMEQREFLLNALQLDDHLGVRLRVPRLVQHITIKSAALTKSCQLPPDHNPRWRRLKAEQGRGRTRGRACRVSLVSLLFSELLVDLRCSRLFPTSA
jgi:hypothetical protein